MLTPWIITIGLIIFFAVVLLVQLDCFGWATILMFATIGAIQYFHVADLWLLVKEHTVQTLIGIFVYTLVGLIWSVVKWLVFLQKFKNKRNKICSSIQRRSKAEDSIKRITSIIRENLEITYYQGTRLIDVPQVDKYKSRIISWGIWWPVSIIGTFLNDFVQNIFSLLYHYLGSYYQKMANKIVPDLFFKNKD
jgi:hypothetical protein